MPTRVTILGSTGSIGQSAIKVLRAYPDEFEVVGISGHANAKLLAEQAAEFQPSYLASTDPDTTTALRELGLDAKILDGPHALEELAKIDTDVVLCGIVGAVGLHAILAAIRAGNRVALANKEPMVMAGHLITQEAAEHGVRILPVDSEHNALFQCLEGHDPADVRTVYLTASGGPFYKRSRESLENVTPEEATNHPTWDMGAKISVDSATLMNKGLEVIEAMWLFDLPLDTIEVVIHPQSIVHGLVEFTDGNILAHLGVTDMTLPIQFALTWPKRVKSPLARLELTQMKTITFDAPDFSEFPCLKHALEAARHGGTAGAVLNAANETAVGAFCEGKIPFLSIAEIVGETMQTANCHKDYTLESILEIDADTRRRAGEIIRNLGAKSR